MPFTVFAQRASGHPRWNFNGLNDVSETEVHLDLGCSYFLLLQLMAFLALQGHLSQCLDKKLRHGEIGHCVLSVAAEAPAPFWGTF